MSDVDFTYGRFGQFRFTWTDKVFDGGVRACRNCGRPVMNRRAKFYCSPPCALAWRSTHISPTYWFYWRDKALARDGRRCVLCGSTEPLEVDHIVPVASDPAREFDLSNLRTLCRPCHLLHGHKPPKRTGGATYTTRHGERRA